MWWEAAPSETRIVGAQANRQSAPSEAGGRCAWTVERYYAALPRWVTRHGAGEVGGDCPIDVVQ
jgi:hypothetical protein